MVIVGDLHGLNDASVAQRLGIMMANVYGSMGSVAKPAEGMDRRLWRSHLMRQLEQHGVEIAGV